MSFTWTGAWKIALIGALIGGSLSAALALYLRSQIQQDINKKQESDLEHAVEQVERQKEVLEWYTVKYFELSNNLSYCTGMLKSVSEACPDTKIIVKP